MQRCIVYLAICKLIKLIKTCNFVGKLSYVSRDIYARQNIYELNKFAK